MINWTSNINEYDFDSLDLKLNVISRVNKNMILFERHNFEGDDILAGRYLFSHLAHLEDIAVLAAHRGNCIENQLEDELVHRKTFETIAEHFGGMVEPSYEIKQIMNYLMTLTGEDSLAALNVVAENWLETVFVSLYKSGLCTDMFKLIGEEEKRHSHEALEQARPDPDAFSEIVQDLEDMLTKISMSPEFMIPLHWFMGTENMALMGLKIAEKHEEACKHLGVQADLHALKVSSRSAKFLNRTAPVPVEMSDWEYVKQQTWDDHAPQYCFIEHEVKETNPLKLQAKLMEAAACVMKRHPRFRNVLRRGQIYRTDHPVIGMRTLYDDEQVLTLYVSRPEKKGWKGTIRNLAKTKRRVKEKPYEPYPGGVRLTPELKNLFPPNRCSLVVTYNGDWGGDFGVGPLSDMEGIPCSLTIGRIREIKDVEEDEFGLVYITKKKVSTFCLMMDHRTGDGKDIGLFLKETLRELDKL
jgi:hypothetical protein